MTWPFFLSWTFTSRKLRPTRRSKASKASKRRRRKRRRRSVAAKARRGSRKASASTTSKSRPSRWRRTKRHRFDSRPRRSKRPTSLRQRMSPMCLEWVQNISFFPPCSLQDWVKLVCPWRHPADTLVVPCDVRGGPDHLKYQLGSMLQIFWQENIIISFFTLKI